jgi:hypothetical protein
MAATGRSAERGFARKSDLSLLPCPGDDPRHVMPKVHRGTDAITNLVSACRSHNSSHNGDTRRDNGRKETKWVWETADNGLMVFVTGITNSHNSR